MEPNNESSKRTALNEARATGHRFVYCGMDYLPGTAWGLNWTELVPTGLSVWNMQVK